MNLKPMLKYCIDSYVKSMVIFYTIYIFCVTIITLLLTFVKGQHGTAVMSLEFSNCVFIFVAAISIIRESLNMGLVNSISRRTVYISNVITAVLFSVVMSIANTVIYLLLHYFTSEISLYAMLFKREFAQGMQPAIIEVNTSLAEQLESTLWMIPIILVAAICGILISLIYYKMNKFMTIVVSALVPFLFIFGLPVLDEVLFNSAFTQILVKGFRLLIGRVGDQPANPYVSMLSVTVMVVLFSGIIYLLMRRIKLKQK